MRTVLSALRLHEPRSLRDALRILREHAPIAPLAGCTDLYVSMNFGTLADRAFVNIWGLDELRGIEAHGDGLRIGSLTTYSELSRSRLVAQRLPILGAASREVGAAQIQNRGTLGGNVANASPAGDTLPVLAVAEAVVVLRSARGTRRVPFNGFYTGYRATVMEPDELIVAFEIPPVPERQWFRKVGTRAAQAISKVVMAGVRAPRPRIALGSVAPTVVRARHAEDVLAAGGSPGDAARALQEDISPIDDVRSTAAYRRRVSANLLAQFWRDTEAEGGRRQAGGRPGAQGRRRQSGGPA
jgi:CO/xanthine dehydrogenase FAD-binding subunit